MLKEIKKMSKKTKIIVLVITAFALVFSVGGFTLYAKDQQQKEELRQEVFNAYWSLNLSQYITSGYNESELKEYDVLVAKREQAFVENDTKVLNDIYIEFKKLDNQVSYRIEQDELYEKEAMRANEIIVLEGATQAEQDIFNQRKQDILVHIQERKPIQQIRDEIQVLSQTNTDIQNRINDEQRQSSAFTNTYNDYAYNGGGGSSGGGGGSSGGSSGSSGGSSGSSGGSSGSSSSSDDDFTPPWTGGDTGWGNTWDDWS